MRTRWMRGGALAIVVAITVAVPAGPAGAMGAGDIDEACRRLPALQRRVALAIDLLEASEFSPGSIDWLEAQLDLAERAGRRQRATYLENRLTSRVAKLTRLQRSRVTLERLELRCDDIG